MSVAEVPNKQYKIERKAPIQSLARPFIEFSKAEASGGVVLMLCVVVAMFLANSPWSADFFAVWDTYFSIGYGDWELSKPLLLWINDGFMAVFFFLVGLEIKREVLVGELNPISHAKLPIVAAAGGMVVPALVYVLVNITNPEGMNGWAIPMATDIAFALGVLMLLGKRAPFRLKVFLTTLAIADDIGAVLIIAIFYTAQLKTTYLLVGVVVFALAVLINRLGVRHPIPYLILGVLLWFLFLKSGVHATIAGVLLAFTIPATVRLDIQDFKDITSRVVERVVDPGPKDHRAFEIQMASLHTIKQSCADIEAPLHRIEHFLNPWVAFFIMPVFALANAGVQLSGDLVALLTSPVTMGVMLGLLVGKPLGIVLFTYIAVKVGFAKLPQGMGWRAILGLSFLAGIGFTMSHFIASLSFAAGPLLNNTKVGILIASAIAGVTGFLLLNQCLSSRKCSDDTQPKGSVASD